MLVADAPALRAIAARALEAGELPLAPLPDGAAEGHAELLLVGTFGVDTEFKWLRKMTKNLNDGVLR